MNVEVRNTQPAAADMGMNVPAILKVGIVGSGQMGSGIAHVCALAGLPSLARALQAAAASTGAPKHPIFVLNSQDANVSVIIETLTEHGRSPIMAQRYIPEIVKGDKRILLVDGEPVPYALARVPAIGETRGNLAAGGSGIAQPLSERDRWIAGQVKSTIKAKGLLFVGLDVIGDYLTEINVTSPTCVREINAAYNLDIAGDLMAVIAEKLVYAGKL
jgi:glutathione synthetase